MDLLSYNMAQIKSINRWWMVLRFFGLSKNDVAFLWIKIRSAKWRKKHFNIKRKG